MNTHAHKGFKRLLSIVHDLDVLRERRAARHRSRPDFKKAEPMNERKFVRLFGDKVRSVRYSGSPDFVGLIVRGDRLGFMVVKHKDHRRIRLIINNGDGWQVSKVYITVEHNDSICAMQKGLLRNVA